MERVHDVCFGLDLPGAERLLLAVPVVGGERAHGKVPRRSGVNDVGWAVVWM